MHTQVSLGIPREPQGSVRIPIGIPVEPYGSPGEPQRDPPRFSGIPEDPRASTGFPEAPRNPYPHASFSATVPVCAFVVSCDVSLPGTLRGGPGKIYWAHFGATPTNTGHTLEVSYEVFSGSVFRSVPVNWFVLLL